MSAYRLARLSEEQMAMIERLENEIGVTLIAYEPLCDAVREDAARGAEQVKAAGAVPEADHRQAVDVQTNLVQDALVDTYRTYDPPV